MSCAATLWMWARMMNLRQLYQKENGHGAPGQPGSSSFIFFPCLLNWVSTWYQTSIFFTCFVNWVSMVSNIGDSKPFLWLAAVTLRNWEWKKKLGPQYGVSPSNSQREPKPAWWLANQRKKSQFSPNRIKFKKSLVLCVPFCKECTVLNPDKFPRAITLALKVCYR